MERPDSLLYQLQELLNAKNFAALEKFREPKKWQKMKAAERELLARLFIQQAIDALQKDEPAAQEHFNIAIKIAGENAHLFYLLGKAYLCVEPTACALNSALELFNHSIKLSAKTFEPWYAIAETLVAKGLLLQDAECFVKACWFCEEAASIAPEQPIATQGLFYWLWGKILYLIGKNSEEAVDYTAALEKLQKASACGIDETEFLCHFGHVYLELGFLFGRSEFYRTATQYYFKAVESSHEYFECWLSLGICYYHLFNGEETWEDVTKEECFQLANRCFENAAKLDASVHALWVIWGQLLYEQGKQEGNIDLIEQSMLKFERAEFLLAGDFKAIFLWGCAEMFLGTVLEDIGYLKEAERKFIAAIAIKADDDQVWCYLGNCLYEMGRYFASDTYYYAAIEKFQAGLAINKKSFALWHGMALSHSSIGEMRNDTFLLQKASNYYAKSVECGGNQVLQCWNDWGINLMKSAEIASDQQLIEAAIEKFECAIELEKSWDPEAEPDVELLYNYGCAYDSLGEFSGEVICYERAIQALSKVIQMDPSHLHGRYNLATALAHLGEVVVDVECFIRAIDQFEQLIVLDPEDEMAWMEYGMTLLTLATLVHDPIVPQKSEVYFQEAEMKFMHALSLGYVQAHYPLACLYGLRGQHDMAMFFMHKAKASNGLPPLEDMQHDEWLEPLRDYEEFQQFMNSLQ